MSLYLFIQYAIKFEFVNFCHIPVSQGQKAEIGIDDGGCLCRKNKAYTAVAPLFLWDEEG